MLKRSVKLPAGASSCPAKPNKKHRRFLRCENWKKDPLTNKLDTDFSSSSPAVLNSYMGLYSHNLFGFCFHCLVDLVDHLVGQLLNLVIAVF